MKVEFTIKGVLTTPFVYYSNVISVRLVNDKLCIRCIDLYREYYLSRITDLVIKGD